MINNAEVDGHIKELLVAYAKDGKQVIETLLKDTPVIFLQIVGRIALLDYASEVERKAFWRWMDSIAV